MKAKECPKCKQIIKNESATYCPTCYTKLEETEYKEADIKKLMKKSPRGLAERALIVLMILAVIVNIKTGIAAIKFTPDDYDWVLSTNIFRPKAELAELADKCLFIDHVFGYICIVFAIIAVVAIIGMILRRKFGYYTACALSVMIIISQTANFFILQNLLGEIDNRLLQNISFPIGTIIYHAAALFINYKHFTTEAYCAYD